MTGTCTLCGDIVKVVPSAAGAKETMGLFLHAFRQHMEAKKHMEQPQPLLEGSDMACTVAQLFAAVMVNAQPTMMLSFVHSEDADFVERAGKMRLLMQKAMTPQPLAAASKLVAP